MEKPCVFCRIIKRESPADILYEDDLVVVFRDARPHAPIHLLVGPRKHIRSLNDLEDGDKAILSEMVFRAREMARKLAIADSGYRLVFNVERGGGQVIFHLHMHLLGGW